MTVPFRLTKDGALKISDEEFLGYVDRRGSIATSFVMPTTGRLIRASSEVGLSDEYTVQVLDKSDLGTPRATHAITPAATTGIAPPFTTEPNLVFLQGEIPLVRLKNPGGGDFVFGEACVTLIFSI